MPTLLNPWLRRPLYLRYEDDDVDGSYYDDKVVDGEAYGDAYDEAGESYEGAGEYAADGYDAPVDFGVDGDEAAAPIRTVTGCLCMPHSYSNDEWVGSREKAAGGSGGSLEPSAPLLTHFHTVFMEYSECLPTLLNPVPKRTPWYQVGSGCVPNRAGDWCDVVPGCPTAQEATDEYPGWDDCVSAAEVGLEVIDTTTVRACPGQLIALSVLHSKRFPQ